MSAPSFHITVNKFLQISNQFWFCLLLLISFPLLASNDLKELCQLNETNESKASLKAKYPIQDEVGNEVLLSAEFDIVRYFSITCGNFQREVLIEFKDKKNPKTVTKGSFLVLGKQKFGNRFYWEIATASGENFATAKSGSPSKPKETLVRPTDSDPNQYENPNLLYFKSLARDNNRRKEAVSNLILFFDHTCPLVFQSKDQNFYWDQSIAYRFEISCTRDSPYGTIRVPGNKNGELVVSGTLAKNLKLGDRFFAKARLTKITDEQAFWGDFQLYYE